MEEEKMVRRLAEEIARQEGFYTPGSLPQRTNNPGDLIWKGQPHATAHAVLGRDGKVRTYAMFDTLEQGWGAMERQIMLYARRGYNLGMMLTRWAPQEDGNPTKEYIRGICRRLGVKPSVRVSKLLEETVPVGSQPGAKEVQGPQKSE